MKRGIFLLLAAVLCTTTALSLDTGTKNINRTYLANNISNSSYELSNATNVSHPANDTTNGSIILSNITSISSPVSHREDPIASALKRMLANVSSTFDSYRFDLELAQMMQIVNLSNQTEAQTILIKSIGAGSLNLTNRSMKLVLASLALSVVDQENASATTLEEYLQNDTIYMKMDGNWTQLKMDMPEVWAEQDMAGQQIEILNHSEITLLGSEKIDGRDCYKIRVAPEMQSFSTIVSQQTGSLLGTMNLGELFNNSSMDLIYWIDKESFLLARMEQTATFDLTPESLRLEATGPQSQRINMVAKSIMNYRDYNEPVEIMLPAEAKEATALPFNLTSAAAA